MFHPILSFTGGRGTFKGNHLSLKVRPAINGELLAFTDDQDKFYRLFLGANNSRYIFFSGSLDGYSEVVSREQLNLGRLVDRVEKCRDCFLIVSDEGEYSIHFTHQVDRNELLALSQMVFSASRPNKDCFNVSVKVRSDQIERAMNLIGDGAELIMGLDYEVAEYSIYCD